MMPSRPTGRYLNLLTVGVIMALAAVSTVACRRAGQATGSG